MNETTVILKVLETTGPCPPTWDTLMLVIGVIEEYPDIAGISGGGTVGSVGRIMVLLNTIGLGEGFVG
jgi:hypothetical protein